MLDDTEMFDIVSKEVFKAIDCDGNGDLDKDEIQSFIDRICEEMGIKSNPDDPEMKEMYSDLAVGDESVSLEKLKDFLRRLFKNQLEQLKGMIN